MVGYMQFYLLIFVSEAHCSVSDIFIVCQEGPQSGCLLGWWDVVMVVDCNETAGVGLVIKHHW